MATKRSLVTEVPQPPVNGHVLTKRFADPDLVDRIFDYVCAMLPELAERQFEIKQAVRAEFAGERVYVRSSGAQDPHPLAVEVLRIFNGRNATEVARRLQIGRATVYRVLKQSGGSR